MNKIFKEKQTNPERDEEAEQVGICGQRFPGRDRSTKALKWKYS